MSLRPLYTLLCFVCLAPAMARAGARSTVPLGGQGIVVAPGPMDGTGVRAAEIQVQRAGDGRNPERTRHDAAGPALYPLYGWPLDRQLRDGLVLVNYVDRDPSAAVLDYENGAHSYDGHWGIDYALFNFRLMDRGCAVRAAAPGVVTWLGNESPFDRHCDFNWPDDGNWIEVSNGDGTYAYYLHMRSQSRTVSVGETVQTGDMLGLVGSSGYSTGPHLHFETGDYLSGSYLARDPYHGAANPLPSLWVSQEGYVGDDPLWFADIGVFTEAQVGGSIFNTTYCDTQEGLVQPVAYGAGETRLCMWAQFQGNSGEVADVEVRRPDGSLYGGFPYTVPEDVRYGWVWAWFYWSGYVSPADYGTWTFRMVVGGSPVRETAFQVGGTTVFPPRFRQGGRSCRITGTAQLDTLRRHPLSPPVTYALLNAPPFASIVNDSVLTIGPSSNQPSRSRFFDVVMTDAAARRDTARFHVVDPSKPLESELVEVTAGQPPGALRLAGPRPNPFEARTELRWDLPRGSHVMLELFDLAGRRVRILVDAHMSPGRHAVTWDGRDAQGSGLPAGIYLARLEAAGDVRVELVARLQ